jgi:hypothetical protein
VHSDWNRMMTTCFNGASNVVQAGGLACLQVRWHHMHMYRGAYEGKGVWGCTADEL